MRGLLLFLLAFPLYAQSFLDVESYLDVKTGQYQFYKRIEIDEKGTIRSIRDLGEQEKRNLSTKNLIFLPGLIDTHTHLFLNDSFLGESFATGLESQVRENPKTRLAWAQAHALDLLRKGFTTVRDLGNAGDKGEEVLRETFFSGPRILISSKGISTEGGQFLPYVLPELVASEYLTVKNETEAKKAIHELVQKKVDWIKIYADNDPNPHQLSRELLEILVKEARKKKMKVAIHAIKKEAIENALLVSPDSLEHGVEITRAQLLTLKKKNIVFVPTDLSGEVRRLFSEFTFSNERGFHPFIKSALEKRLQLAKELGVKIAFGSDYYYDLSAYGLSFGEGTLECLLGMNFSSLELLQMATMNAGMLLSGEKIGLIAEGYKADLIAVASDPLRNIHTLRDVRFVMKEGKILKASNPNP